MNDIKSTCSYENHKQRTEAILKALTASRSHIEVVTNLVKNITVNVHGMRAFSVYFRKDSVRINVPLNSQYLSLCKSLEDQKIAYQKNSANSYANTGAYAFFVDDKNEEYAYRFLLGLPASNSIGSDSSAEKE